jgi:hypothetical protein
VSETKGGYRPSERNKQCCGGNPTRSSLFVWSLDRYTARAAVKDGLFVSLIPWWIHCTRKDDQERKEQSAVNQSAHFLVRTAARAQHIKQDLVKTTSSSC